MKKQFSEIKETLHKKLVQIDCADNLTVTTAVVNIEDIYDLDDTLESKVILYVKKTIKEKIGELIPKVVESGKHISAYLYFLKATYEKILESESMEIGTEERNRHFCNSINSLITSLGDFKNENYEKICFYQLYFPLNGVFLTTGAECEEWAKFSELFAQHQDEFLETVTQKNPL